MIRGLLGRRSALRREHPLQRRSARGARNGRRHLSRAAAPPAGPFPGRQWRRVHGLSVRALAAGRRARCAPGAGAQSAAAHPRATSDSRTGCAVRGGRASNTPSPGMAAYRPDFFAGCADGVFPLKPCWCVRWRRSAARRELYHGRWEDVGTPERLAALNGASRTYNTAPLSEFNEALSRRNRTSACDRRDSHRRRRASRAAAKNTLRRKGLPPSRTASSKRRGAALFPAGTPAAAGVPALRKPPWLRAPMASGADFAAVKVSSGNIA